MSLGPPERPVNTRLLLGGAVLMGLGSMLAMSGLALGSAAMIGAGRRWQQRTEMTPAQLAKHALGAAQAASAAGAGVWRGPVPVASRRFSNGDARIPVS